MWAFNLIVGFSTSLFLLDWFILCPHVPIHFTFYHSLDLVLVPGLVDHILLRVQQHIPFTLSAYVPCFRLGIEMLHSPFEVLRLSLLPLSSWLHIQSFHFWLFRPCGKLLLFYSWIIFCNWNLLFNLFYSCPKEIR